MEKIIQKADYEKREGPSQQGLGHLIDSGQEVLEDYLARLPKAPSNFNHETQVKEDESDASFDDADNTGNVDNGVLLGKHENLEAARAFLVNSDAFLRLIEDLRDFIAPFEDPSIWNKDKVLWEGSQQVRFERHVDVQSPGLIDRLKLSTQKRAGASIRWWPFSQPKRHLDERMIRIVWACVST